MTGAATETVARPRVTCIIPAYNEGARIGAVLASVVGHPLIDEVIVVDDGSGDDTARVAGATVGARLIRLERNRGKTAALSVALAAAGAGLILLVDADLSGLEARHLTSLIRPVLDGRADMSISLRQNAPWIWRRIGLDYISGERVLHKALLSGQIEVLKTLPKFGFEVFLNGLCIANNCRLAVVPWDGVRSPMKNAKYGVWRGLGADLGMMSDLFRSAGPVGLVRQILAMRRLRVPPGRARRGVSG